LQPDSIIPNPANPQSLNRFGYVVNNPIKFNDPTGHAQKSDDYRCHGCTPTPPSTPDLALNNRGESENGCHNDPDCNEYDEGGTGPMCLPGELACQIDKAPYDGYDLNDFCPLSATLVYCWEHNQPLYMGNGPLYIDPAEWDALLLAIRNDIRGMNRQQLIAAALFYDTPFYDNSFYGFGKLPGIGCINQRCYSRSELNYVAQGELWAAAGFSIEETMTIVQLWKLSPIMHFPTVASGGTLVMTNIGYYDYQSHYPNEFP